MGLKINHLDESRAIVTEEMRKAIEAEKARKQIEKLIAVENRIQQAVDEVLKTRKKFNKAAKELTDFLGELKKFMDENDNIVDYPGYYRCWNEQRKKFKTVCGILATLPEPDEIV